MKLIILDLDETLLFATKAPLSYSPDYTVSDYYVYFRPYVKEFLRFCKQHFQVAIWTASTKPYADAIINNLCYGEISFEFIWARERCTFSYDEYGQSINYIKKLKKVKKLGYDLEDIIMIDDSPEKHIHNYGNLVRVTEFEGDINDIELLQLKQYLLSLKDVENIRNIEKRNWRKHFIK